MNSPKVWPQGFPGSAKAGAELATAVGVSVGATIPGAFVHGFVSVERLPLAEPESFRRRVRLSNGQGSPDQER
jgi:hypothetical protein